MAWNPFRRRDKQAPAAPAGPEQPKRRRLGRLFGRKPAPVPPPGGGPAEAPEAPETGGGTPAPTPAPPAPSGTPVPGTPKRVYPKSLDVSATGTWKISSSIWHGTASGTLTGAAVKVFLDAIEAGDLDVAVFLIAQAYDNGSGFAQNLDLSGTSVDISYS